MKKLVCLLLVCVLCIPIFASCGKEKPVEFDDDYEVLRVVIEKSGNGKQALVNVNDQNKDDYFYATDEDGICYRVEDRFMDWDIAKEGAVVYLSYLKGSCKTVEIEDDEHGFTPKYAVSPKGIWSEQAWKLKDIANEKASKSFGVPADHLKLFNFYLHDDGRYEFIYSFYLGGIRADSVDLILDEKGNIVPKEIPDFEEDKYFKYVGTGVERAIPSVVARMESETGSSRDGELHLSFVEEDGVLYLRGETITFQNGDHHHAMYKEKLGSIVNPK